MVLDYRDTPTPSAAIGVWISLIVGLLCLMLGWNFTRWLARTATGQPFDTGALWTAGNKTGQPVAYFDLQGGTAWTEMAFFTMGVALLLDAVLIFIAGRAAGSPNRTLTWAAVVITGLAMLLNVGLVLYLLSIGITPLASMILLLVGGFVLFDHLPTLKRADRLS